MIGYNETGEARLTWEFVRSCRELIQEYGKSKEEIVHTESAPKFMEELVAHREGAPPNAYEEFLDMAKCAWWFLTLLGEFEKMRRSGKYVYPFREGKVGPRARELLAVSDAGLVWEKSGEGAPEAEIPAELLQGLREEKKAEVTKAYGRLLCLEEANALVAYARDFRKALFDCLAKPQDWSPCQAIQWMYDMTCGEQKGKRKHAGQKPGGLLAKAVEQARKKDDFKLDVFDNEVSALEQIARAYDLRLRDQQAIFLPEKVVKENYKRPEALLLLALMYGRYPEGATEAERSDFWSVPGGHTALGIYASNDKFPSAFFDAVERTKKTANFPFEIIKQNGVTLVRIRGDVRRMLEEAFKSFQGNPPKADDAIGEKAGDGSKAGSAPSPGGQKPDEGMDKALAALNGLVRASALKDDVPSLLWEQLRARLEEYLTHSKNVGSARLITAGDVQALQLDDNGGTGAYEQLDNYIAAAYREEIVAVKREDDELFQMFRLGEMGLSAEAYGKACVSLGKHMELFVRKGCGHDFPKKSTSGRLKLMVNRSATWTTATVPKLFLGFLYERIVEQAARKPSGQDACFQVSDGLSEREVAFEYQENNPSGLLRAISGVIGHLQTEEGKEAFAAYRTRISKSDHRLSLNVQKEDGKYKVRFSLYEKYMPSKTQDCIGLEQWLFEDGPYPGETAETALRSWYAQGVMKFLDNRQGIGKDGKFSRALNGIIKREDMVLRLALAYCAYALGGEREARIKSGEMILDAKIDNETNVLEIMASAAFSSAGEKIKRFLSLVDTGLFKLQVNWNGEEARLTIAFR